MDEVDRIDAFLSELEFGSDDDEPEMTIDEFLAGVAESDTDDEPDPLDVPSPEPVKKPRFKIRDASGFMSEKEEYKKILDEQEKRKSMEVKEDDYGSISWQKKRLGDVPTKTVDCVVYHYDENSDFLINPDDLSDIGEWKGEGEDPEWFDEDTHNELKEKYNQNIKKKAGKFNGCY